MVDVELQYKDDQFRRVYYYDAAGQRDINVTEDGYGNAAERFDRVYDVRGLLTFNARIINRHNANSVDYIIEETTADFDRLDDIDPDDWFAVTGGNVTVAARSRSAAYSKLLSDGIRAVRIRMKRTAAGNSVTVQVHVTGEI